MSSCFFISSNSQLKEVMAANTTINLDKPEENDVSIYKMLYYKDEYSGMKYANEIEYYAVCNAQVQQILDYIKNVIIQTDIVELWRVWISDYGNPMIKTREILIANLTAEYLYGYLMELEKAPYFAKPLHDDEERPIYYRLKICK